MLLDRSMASGEAMNGRCQGVKGRARGCEVFHPYRAAQALPDLEAQVPQKV